MPMNGTGDGMMDLASRMVETYEAYGGINRLDLENLPSPQAVIAVLHDLLKVIFPGFRDGTGPRKSEISLFVDSLLDTIHIRLSHEVEKGLRYECRLKDCDSTGCEATARESSLALLEKLPSIRKTLKGDLQAAYNGDPAARTIEEVIVCYPFVEAITVHRIAHELYSMEVPLIPRIMSEWAHGRTGIDIHPGAEIGRGFFIDHGTGVVIGETTEIGDNVKIYQGVTLGALSFPKDDHGRVVKGGKRHPTIEDDVTIYAGATILGGKTVIGKGSVIGANAWLTSSVPPFSRVTIDVAVKHEVQSGDR
jgi:serine O-acetyltransferase